MEDLFVHPEYSMFLNVNMLIEFVQVAVRKHLGPLLVTVLVSLDKLLAYDTTTPVTELVFYGRVRLFRFVACIISQQLK